MKVTKPAFKRIAALFTLIGLVLVMSGCSNLIVLDPKGPIAEQQRDLIWFTIILCLVVLIPVLALTAFIVWRYREKPNSTAPYHPEWEHSTKLEAIWWGIPILIIIVLGTVTVRYTYDLIPSKPIESANETMTIQVTSLDWKWLFIYPEQGIATVNYLQIPEDVPVRFQLTSDAPMNSFWVPQLGGQIYTMSGMVTTLHLQSDEPGEYLSSGANFSGEHFEKMRFVTKATTQNEFDAWVNEVKATSPTLTIEGYKLLAQPGVTGQQSFSAVPKGLFQKVVTKYSAEYNHELSQRDIQDPVENNHEKSKDENSKQQFDDELETLPTHGSH